MAERLQSAVSFQRQLLRDLSHEMRAPLSRLRAAADRGCRADALSCRVTQEVKGMEQLIGGSLELVWLDTERPSLPREEVDVGALWDVLRDDACFESGWASSGCHAIFPSNAGSAPTSMARPGAGKHSAQRDPSLAARGERAPWDVWKDSTGTSGSKMKDRSGARSAGDDLSTVHSPECSEARGDGFGLGLAIARRMVQLQGGELWAENLDPGFGCI